MATLHQLRCFLATLEHGSFTAAAVALGYAQPSISEQVRLLEQHLQVTLFLRVGRGVVPTEAALALRPHAAAALAAVEEAGRAVAAVREVLSGTVRLGLFGTARFYLGADLVADVLERHPGVRVQLIGQNSAEVLDHVRRGRLEAAVSAVPVPDEGLSVTPVMRDELVYVSTEARDPVTPAYLASRPLVLPHVSWREEDTTRRALTRAVQAAGHVLRPRVEVEDPETALEIAARGLAATVSWRGVLHRLADRLPDTLRWSPLDPPLHDTFAIVHGPTLSPSTRMVLELASARLRALEAQVRR
ncbi:LysR family transcriptional regulator [Nonomuraea dietziae]|uniref:DNA-binding transcriptional LysR family regulator n=1 Tax=Nonomuraea dietziae TaxID=65515 RepID=A0A7W5Y9U8_9ACTN|nr:LysR family transcriptional regulator [Nonomuraea dietziae]MBB3730113.1 DNA-binding transcriptional LysR family regulator [Nonomuraea dietziae]